MPQARVLRVRDMSAAPGSRLTVPVELFAEGNERVVQFSLRFDPGSLGFVGAELGRDAVGAHLILDYAQAAAGILGVTIELPSERQFETGNNRLLDLNFSLSEDLARSSVVEFTDYPVKRLASDSSAQELVVNYSSGAVAVAAAIEGDVSPRPNGSADGALTVGDWIQAGRFVAKLDLADNGSEFQRADTAPRSTSGNGQLTLADWVQTGRYSEGLDPAQTAGGPTAPSSFAEAAAAVAGALAGANGIEEQSQVRVVRAVDATFTRGQDNNLTIEFDAQGDENAVAFTLNYNPAHVTFVRAVLGTGVPQPANPVLNVNTSQLSNGRVGFAVALRAGQNFGAGTRQLLVITFTVPLLGNQNTSIASFGDDPIARAVVNTNADAVTATFNQGVLSFTPTVNAIPTITSLSPNFVIVGGPTFTLIVNGTDFVNGAFVRVDGVERATRFISSTELQAFLPASDIAETATHSITVVNPPPGGGVSNSLTLSVNNPFPSISDVSPSVLGVNAGAQTLTVIGSGFVPGAIVRWNGQNRSTTFVNSNQLTANILSSDLSSQGTAKVTVLNPTPGGGLSNEVTITIIPASPIPRISALDPPTWPTQGGAFTLKVTGVNFAQNAIVRWAGDPRPTTFISSTELRAQISAADVANEVDVFVSVVNPPPGGGNSNNLVFHVAGVPNPTPQLTAISPNAVTSGGGDFTLIATGAGFIGSSVIQFNGQARQTTFVSANELQARIFASDIATGGVAQITVSTPLPGGGTSNPLPLSISLGQPTIVFLSPNSALAGGPGFTLSVIGSSFTSNSVVRWNGSDRPTTFVDGTELRAQIPATDIAAVGSAQVTVNSPSPGGGLSNPSTFTITQSANPLPRINTINPTSALVGGPAFTLTVNGSGFVPGSLVRWNGSPRQTSFVSDAQLTAQITASDIASIGTATITVFNSTPGGGGSNGVNFSVTPTSGLPPVITNITPTTVNSGGQGFTLAVEGSNFTPTSVVQFNSDTRPTRFISANQLTADITEADILIGGSATINVFNPPPGAGTSNVVILTILNGVPTISNIVPTRIGTGSGTATITVNGSNFASGVVVRVNGANRPTTLINSNQLTVQILASDRAAPATLSLVAVNPAPGGGSSNSVSLEVRQTAPIPRLTSISPDTANAGSAGLTLVVTGTNFTPDSIVRWANRDLATEFISSNTLTATVTANDLLLGGQVPVRVFTPEPGGGTSGAINFSINSPIPQINNVSPNPVTGGSQPVTITVVGLNFVGSSVVRFNGQDRPTSFLGTTQLAATLSALDLVGISSATITVFSPEPGGGLSNGFTLSIIPGQAPVPVLSSLDPGAVIVGNADFTLTVNGSNLVPTSVVLWNGSARATTFVNANRLTAQIPASDVASVGTAVITILTPGPGGGVSNPVNFGIISGPPPAPILTSLNPTTATIGAGFTLTVNGSNFAPNSVVQVNGSPRSTGFVSGSQLTAQILTSDVSSVGSLAITVFTPAPGGGTSNTLFFSVVTTPNPVPVILSLNPVSATAGGPAFTLSVNGSNFVAGSIVRWNGIDQATTFVSGIQLDAQIPASNIASVGTASITVFTPGPGGGTSNEVLFGINSPGAPPGCSTICLRSARYYERNTARLPNGLVLIGGVNANTPIPIQGNTQVVKDALHGGLSAIDQLNKEYVAIQISLILAGSSSIGGLQSAPNCYGVSFSPVLLGNGVTLTSNSTTGDILAQVRAAIYAGRVEDMPALAAILALMNGDDPSNICNRSL
jgi:hypothetical protein